MKISTLMTQSCCVALQNLLDLVANDMSGEACQKDAALVAFHNNTLVHIEIQKAKAGPLAERYSQIKVQS